MKCQMEYMDSIKKLEEKWSHNQQKPTNNTRTDGTSITEVVILLCPIFISIILIINTAVVVLLRMTILNVSCSKY